MSIVSRLAQAYVSHGGNLGILPANARKYVLARTIADEINSATGYRSSHGPITRIIAGGLALTSLYLAMPQKALAQEASNSDSDASNPYPNYRPLVSGVSADGNIIILNNYYLREPEQQKTANSANNTSLETLANDKPEKSDSKQQITTKPVNIKNYVQLELEDSLNEWSMPANAMQYGEAPNIVEAKIVNNPSQNLERLDGLVALVELPQEYSEEISARLISSNLNGADATRNPSGKNPEMNLGKKILELYLTPWSIDDDVIRQGKWHQLPLYPLDYARDMSMIPAVPVLIGIETYDFIKEKVDSSTTEEDKLGHAIGGTIFSTIFPVIPLWMLAKNMYNQITKRPVESILHATTTYFIFKGLEKGSKRRRGPDQQQQGGGGGGGGDGGGGGGAPPPPGG